jgi:ABC-type branched-subunit amino acid transport system ATPase component
VLRSGTIAHSGPAKDLRSDPALAQAYLGASQN